MGSISDLFTPEEWDQICQAAAWQRLTGQIGWVITSRWEIPQPVRQTSAALPVIPEETAREHSDAAQKRLDALLGKKPWWFSIGLL